MAEFQKVKYNLKRLCESYTECYDCPLRDYACKLEYITTKSESVIEQWAQEHTPKTNRQALWEVFPHIDMDYFCPKMLTAIDKEVCNTTKCADCLNQWLDSEYNGG